MRCCVFQLSVADSDISPHATRYWFFSPTCATQPARAHSGEPPPKYLVSQRIANFPTPDTHISSLAAELPFSNAEAVADRSPSGHHGLASGNEKHSVATHSGGRYFNEESSLNKYSRIGGSRADDGAELVIGS
jgi:hypothetical protein